MIVTIVFACETPQPVVRSSQGATSIFFIIYFYRSLRSCRDHRRVKPS